MHACLQLMGYLTLLYAAAPGFNYVSYTCAFFSSHVLHSYMYNKWCLL